MFNVNSRKNWLERLADKIPGLGDYLDRDRRREIDKVLREQVADRLRHIKTIPNTVLRDLSDTGRLFEVGPLDRILKKLDKMENRIRFATYGYSGFFDAVKIDDFELDQIYQFDLTLLDLAEIIEADANVVAAQAGDATTLKAAAAALEKNIDALDAKFTERYNKINTI
ncbi:MAG TPA: hypothetical protein PKZ53_16515 [Acidobacteriota bacterium]|nr:hypothetical protein [Acidobacteriota bacterium]HNB73027.1 hypothetical protein [Acidobacteriota bacterium]HNG93079.1 hypothetical protein [Acidobacteriota bacterium]HNH83890.1 hypothetical protein [Acidobacteriota bacterium]HNJ42093.1 hypothetical protein [Acidobacteriota bacterium]